MRKSGKQKAGSYQPKRMRSGSGASRKQDVHMRKYMLQFVVCAAFFVLLVAVKLLLPQKMALVNEKLNDALERNMDVKAVFSAVGNWFAEDGAVSHTAEKIYKAVFLMEPPQEVQTAARYRLEVPIALAELQHYRTDGAELPSAEPPADAEPAQANDAYVLYSNQNLPEHVTMEQVILNLDYCTPVAGQVSSNFGYRQHPVEGEDRFHYGLDLAADTGTAIHCFAGGTVTAVGESSSYGKYCVVRHENGCSTLYAHCSKILATSGKEVSKNEKIAEVGESGMATGPHLHFELQKDGTYLNPIYYVSVQ